MFWVIDIENYNTTAIIISAVSAGYGHPWCASLLYRTVFVIYLKKIMKYVQKQFPSVENVYNW